jgi:hypothetical protein
MPELRRLLVADDPATWAAAGFAVNGDRTAIGAVAIRFVDGPERGVRGWELAPTIDESVDDGAIDGIPTARTDEPVPPPQAHPNGVSRLDHVVIATPDVGRTITALEAAGFETRRTRDVPGSEPPRRQVFLWAGEPILEVAGPVAPSGGGPASISGLALTTDDLDAAAALLGPRLSSPKDAVQPGRRIATIDTRSLGISTGLALMTPHVPVGPAGPDHASLTS